MASEQNLKNPAAITTEAKQMFDGQMRSFQPEAFETRLKSGGHQARKLRHLAGKAIHGFDLIHEGDRIAIGVSGGKDSLLLSAFLADLKHRAPVKFQLGAIHLGPDEKGQLARWLDGLDLDFIHFEAPPEVPEIALWRPGGPSPCFICSRARRNRLFSLCRDLGVNRLALGHHLDDGIETLLMNIMHSGRVEGLKCRQDLFDGRLSIIRPLFLVPEALIIKLSEAWALPVAPKSCPADGHTIRQEIKEMIADLTARRPKVYGNLTAAATSMGSALKNPPDFEQDI